MADLFILDSGPLGAIVADPGFGPGSGAILRLTIAAAGGLVVLPEIADFEVRRELLRREARRPPERLDRLRDRYMYAPITTGVMRQAAAFWAELRQGGIPTADPHALDADVILAAQAARLSGPGDRLCVLTTNPRHLSRMVPTLDWASLA